MELVSTVWHVVSLAIVFFIGLLIVNELSKPFNLNKNRAFMLYFWHTLFCIIYAIYAINFGADAVFYYNRGVGETVDFGLGTSAIVFIVSMVAPFFDLSFLGVFFVFNIFGTIGLLAFYASLQVVIVGKSKNIHRLVTLIIFLPSVSFWSSSIGKDSLSFMAVGLALWAALNLKRRIGLMMTAVLVMLLVRPHMAGIMVLALSGSMLLQRRISLAQRLMVGVVAISAAIILVPLATKYSGLGSIEELGINSVAAYIDKRQGYNQIGGGSIDISTMNVPMQMFTYLFRPLPFEAHSIFAFLSSIDNILLLVLIVFSMRGLKNPRHSSYGGNHMFMWLYVFSSWFILASTTANLGISVRQKWMFVPVLIVLLFSYIGNRSSDKVSS